jgi:periplasmic copper chaperone A
MRRRSIAAFVLAVLAVLLASTGEAHVAISPVSTYAGEMGTLSFQARHGCGDAPTTRIIVRIPEDVRVVRPQIKPGWTITTKTEKYAQPVVLGHETWTEGFSEVTWSGGSIPSTYMDNFVIVARMPERAGETVRFSVEQQCEGVAEPVQHDPEVFLTPSWRTAQTGSSSAGGGGHTPGSAGARQLPLPTILSAAALLVALIAMVLALRRRAA